MASMSFNVPVPFAVRVRTITATGSVDSQALPDYQILCNFSAAGSLTLPPPSSGRVLKVKDVSGSAAIHSVTIAQHATEKIDGGNSYVLSVNSGAVELTSDGTNWYVTASYNGIVI
jgi:hypothetical protein